LAEETIDGTACWKLRSTPRQAKVSQYSHSYVWIRKDNYALSQIENYSKTQLIRRAHYTDIRNDQGIWTAHQIDMHDLKRNSHTILKIEKLQYKIEYEFSFYQGFNHLRSFDAVASRLNLNPPLLEIDIQGFHPKLLMGGGDVAIPTPLFTVKAEAAHFSSSDD